MSGLLRRRSFLAALAGSVAGSALSRRGLANTLGRGGLLGNPPAASPPTRLVLLMQNNGTQQSQFWPTAGFTSPILAPLLGDPSLAKKTTVVRGVFYPHDANGTNANEHDMGFARMFTGAKLLSVGNQPWGGAASVDQIVAKAWATESLALGVLTSNVEPHPKTGFEHRRSFCYVGPGQHKLPTLDPFVAYQLLFAPPAPPGDAAAKQRLVLRKSALDAVMGNLTEMRARLGPLEQAKLDLHLTSIREMEQRLSQLIAGQASPGASCALRPSAPKDYTNTAPALLLNDESAIPELVTTMLDLMATSLGCGLVRVATLQLGFGGGKWMFAWEGINQEFHGQIAHRDTSDAGSSPGNTDLVVRANHYYASQVAYLAKRLDAIPEGDGTVLDHTLIVWANELGRGDHNQSNVPIVLIGGKTPGGRLVDTGPQTFQRVGCSVLGAMGLPAAGFGDEPTCGPLQGV